jgi:hypothetical protein
MLAIQSPTAMGRGMKLRVRAGLRVAPIVSKPAASHESRGWHWFRLCLDHLPAQIGATIVCCRGLQPRLCTLVDIRSKNAKNCSLFLTFEPARRDPDVSGLDPQTLLFQEDRK